MMEVLSDKSFVDTNTKQTYSLVKDHDFVGKLNKEGGRGSL